MNIYISIYVVLMGPIISTHTLVHKRMDHHILFVCFVCIKDVIFKTKTKSEKIMLKMVTGKSLTFYHREFQKALPDFLLKSISIVFNTHFNIHMFIFQKPVYVLQLYKLKSNNNLRRDQNYDYARVLSSFKK